MSTTTSTLPMLSVVLVVVLLFHTPRSAAQEASCLAGQFPTPPPPRLSTQKMSGLDPSPDPTAQRKSQVWNVSRYYYPATDFGSKVTPPMFALWPENLRDVKYEHYSEDASDHARTLEEFVYEEDEGYLVHRPYFDVGPVDEHSKLYYYRVHHSPLWQGDIKRITCPLRFEFNDLQRLSASRLKRNVWGMGLGYGVAALTILQVAVIVFTALLRMCTYSTQQRIGISSASASTWWSKICHFLHIWISETPWIDCICDWIHLVLLVVNGFAMMEGVDPSDFLRWRSMLLYNIAVNYTYLTLFSMISSFLHQGTYFLTRRSFTVPAPPRNTTPAADGAASGLSEDWRYQRIFWQFGVLVLMGIYLIGVDTVDDDEGQGIAQGMDSLWGIAVAAIVEACVWSAGVSAVVVARSVRDMGRCLLPGAWKVLAFFDSRSRAHAQPASPQPASNVSTAAPVPTYSRSKTM